MSMSPHTKAEKRGRSLPLSAHLFTLTLLLAAGVVGLGAATAQSSRATATLESGGTVVAWGFGDYGQTDVPVGLGNVRAVAAAGNYSLALKTDGTVVGWGSPEGGATSVPEGLSGVVAIAAGPNHALALKGDGTVVAWGYGGVGGATDVPAGLTNVVAITAGATHSLALKADGTVVGWGNFWMGLNAAPPGLTDVVAIAAGEYHNLALKADGTVAAWGANYFGETNVPEGLTDVVAVAAGLYDSLALRADGTVVAWGSGATDMPAGLTDVVAIAAGWSHCLALKADGTVVAWGSNFHGESGVPVGLAGVVAIAAGDYHNLALLAESAPSDTAPPATSIALSPPAPDGQNGWYVSDVSVSVSATDDDSGVAETRCVLDPAAAPASFADVPTSCPYAGAGGTVNSVGLHTVYTASQDAAGNAETPVSVSFKIGYSLLWLKPAAKKEFKVGSSIPVRFALTDGTAARIADADAQALASGNQAAVLLDGTALGYARYDPDADQFVFKVNTDKKLALGSHTISVDIFIGGEIAASQTVTINIVGK
jgi:Regulator of Chromosome Condensation (RCC1) repeat protein